MYIKSIFILALLTGIFAGASFAGGSHGHGHGKREGMNHSNMEVKGHSEMEGMAHDEEHQHDSGGSPVGEPGLAGQATKIVHVITLDTMRYEFSPQPDIRAGDIVKFIVTNQGKIPHEFSIGDENEQKAHAKMMREMPNMVHEDGNTVTVKPGETNELTWKFKAGSEVVFACNIPGHYEAGMFKKIILTK
ncbi:MAG: cupredoxin family protein [Pseudomonadales bacterium]|nr:cupredoxin family protein [Pseudomonadales bacterium]